MSQGSRHNKGKLRWRNVPLFLFEPIIEVGARAEKHQDNPNGKYDTFNFLKGLMINDTLDSIKRHLMKLESPYESDYDEESGLNHAAHIAWNAMILCHFLETRKDLDDRYKIKKLSFGESTAKLFFDEDKERQEKEINEYLEILKKSKELINKND